MIYLKTQIINLAILLISIHECVFGNPECQNDLNNLCNGSTTAEACKTTIFYYKLYENYAEGSYSRRYYDYICQSTSLFDVLSIEDFCRSSSRNAECIAKIKMDFKIEDNSERNQKLAAHDYAFRNMNFIQLLSTISENNIATKYSKDYFTHLEKRATLGDDTLSYYSWCEMLECIQELKLLCIDYLTAISCKDHIFNNELYEYYEEGSYSRRYIDYIGNAVTLSDVIRVETFCQAYTSRMSCVAEIITKFNIQDLLSSHQIIYSFNYAFREMTLDNFTEDEVYARTYFKDMNIAATVINNTLHPEQWCLKIF